MTDKGPQQRGDARGRLADSQAHGTPLMNRSVAWITLATLLLFSMAAPLNQFKVPPIMPILMQSLGQSVAGAGLLMSVYAVTGLILALPSGFIFQKAGYRATGLLAGGSIVLGATLGALSRGMGGLLASRAIEGIGTGFMAVLAPALIAQWFAARQRGTAMGIWSAWVPLGITSMMVIAPLLAQSSGWRSVWWLGAGYALVVTLLYLGFVKPAPTAAETQLATPKENTSRHPIAAGVVLGNWNIWLLAAAFGAFNAAVTGLSTYLPTFLSTRHGLPLAQAAFVSSIVTLLNIVSTPAGGILSDRVGSRKRLYLVGLAAAIILMPLLAVASVTGIIALVIINGLVLGLIPSNIFSSAIEVVGDERQSGLAMAMIMVGQNAGMLLGPIVFGTLAEASGWPAAFGSLAVMCALGLVSGWLAKVR